jgi:hypothetical protein
MEAGEDAECHRVPGIICAVHGVKQEEYPQYSQRERAIPI